MRPERVGVANGDEPRRERGVEVVGNRRGCEGGVVEEATAARVCPHMMKRRPAGVLAWAASAMS